MDKRVILGLSGGVDSAVTARLLLEQGYEVIGVYLDIGAGGSGADDAAAVAASLSMPFVVRSIKDELECHVCKPFAEDYLAGRTPLPCARCNPTVKFPALLAEADARGIAKIATGHYARAKDGVLYRGEPSNDQSYLLARLPQKILQRVLFPLGGFEKTAVRDLAVKYGIPVANKPDSMEICFVPDDDYAAWLEARGATAPPGDFIDKEGNVLGKHKGIHCYTLGQRRGLGVSGPHRYFVTAIDPVNNTVTLSDGGDLGRTEVICYEPNWLTESLPTKPFECQVRLRHSKHSDLVTVAPNEEGKVIIRSDTLLRAPTPGQLAVFYEGERVLGSAWIQ